MPMSLPDPSLDVHWMYIDMNAFFASVEQMRHPHLRGRPIGVIPLESETTCCIAASYEAKRKGVKTGTRVADARLMCPGIEFVVADHHAYVDVHHQIVDTIESLLHIDSVCSIDEVACRLTGKLRSPPEALKLAIQIKKALRQRVGEFVLCSIGIAPSHLLAKIATDMEKPDGLVLIRPKDLPHILYPLSIRDVPGIGRAMEKHLIDRGVVDMPSLLALSEERMRAVWGSIVGVRLRALLHGEDLPFEETERSEFGHSRVLDPELRTKPHAFRFLKRLAAKAALRMRREGFWARRVRLYIRYQGDRPNWDASERLGDQGGSQDTVEIIQTLERLWPRVPEGRIYIVGMALSDLIHDDERPPSFFDDPSRKMLTELLDEINDRFGKDKIQFGITHDAGGDLPAKVAFTRIPDREDQ